VLQTLPEDDHLASKNGNCYPRRDEIAPRGPRATPRPTAGRLLTFESMCAGACLTLWWMFLRKS